VFGGIAIAGNLLAVASTDARGRVFLFDLEDERLASSWSWSAADGGPSDAGGVAFDRAYNIYVADTRNDLVRCFSPFGMPVRVFGVPQQREPGSTVRDAPGRLDRPHAVAVLDDVLFVACGDRWLVRGVQRFALLGPQAGDSSRERRVGRPEGPNQESGRGLPGRRGSDDAQPSVVASAAMGEVLPPLRAFGESDARFGAPRGICAEAGGIWVADTQHGVVQRFRSDGSFVARIATAGTHGAESRPIAVLPQRLGTSEEPALLVADAGDEPGLRVVLPSGRQERAPANDELVEPSALARDAGGRIHVFDRHGERVVRLTADLRVDRIVVDLLEVGFGG